MVERMDELARRNLEEQRDFLLASLRDLERERIVGDVDDADYQALRSSYTARAADIIRRIEGGAPGSVEPAGRSVVSRDAWSECCWLLPLRRDSASSSLVRAASDCRVKPHRAGSPTARRTNSLRRDS
jgi:hypothetical protein